MPKRRSHRNSGLYGALGSARFWTLPFIIVLAIAITSCNRSAPAPEESSPAGADAAVSPGFPSDPREASVGINPDKAFWETWGDGQAELASYELSIPRYGTVREGTAVAIFVTETFSNEARVKADPGKHPPEDEFPVMKLNLVEDFPTGIYDYNVMTSAFVALKAVGGMAAGHTTKVSFSSQEWCGHVYHQLLFGQYGVKSHLHSYFDGEADESKDLPLPRSGISGDALLHWARGMALPTLSPGQTLSVPFLPSLKEARFRHQPLGWREVRLSRSAEPQTITVPAGTFEVDVMTADVQGSPARRYYVERAAPHRVIRWEADDGEKAELVRQIRSKYWQQNDPGSASVLSELGLSPRPAKTM